MLKLNRITQLQMAIEGQIPIPAMSGRSRSYLHDQAEVPGVGMKRSRGVVQTLAEMSRDEDDERNGGEGLDPENDLGSRKRDRRMPAKAN